MRKIYAILPLACALTFTTCDDYDDTALWEAVNGLEERIAALEQWQDETNNNIAALQKLLTTNDMITSVTPVMMGDETVGYTISFLHSDPITIYHGKKGDKGEDGVDGSTPQIGLTQQTDGNWYWTLNGELMTDSKGNHWFADQLYTGFNAYGCEYGTFVSRGKITVKNTDFPEIFTTEAYGAQMFYQIPLPNGRYTVKIHFAETYEPNRENGRTFDLQVGGTSRKNLNPVHLGGGFQSAASVTWEEVEVKRGLLTIKASGNPAINGIEIFKEDK